MEQIAAEATADGAELGEIKRRIDGKGTVIFTLDSGGTIRDTGKEIFFSGHNPKAEQIAMRYAAKKWGKHISLGKGHIKFNLKQELANSLRQGIGR